MTKPIPDDKLKKVIGGRQESSDLNNTGSSGGRGPELIPGPDPVVPSDGLDSPAGDSSKEN